MAGAPARGQGAPGARGVPRAGWGAYRAVEPRGRARARAATGRARAAGGRALTAAGGRASGARGWTSSRAAAGGRAGAVGSGGGSQGRARLRAVTAPRPARRPLPPYLSLRSGAPGRRRPSPRGQRRPLGAARGRGRAPRGLVPQTKGCG